ncbi:MalY/PatB family protein [Polynucleobacter sp. AP-Kaivos-20-H2]|uniref:MalY/PatB family protein n=1 Tax=Polynucleobacter sp. AP-Kaivos-20-H2 TaxID=2689104 RepID=UPI001C0D19F7|nr:PatB family C-S lyase [Polynucleobacter sp. AP-Kaivos-20-H2]MBU3605051.1 putative C-S lyase [Polynucleobacter sp. AP-Kaivos-20-H2]
MAFDFDTPTNRLKTDSIRWDITHSKEVLPLWVADMDFKSPPCVIQALNDRVQQGIYGYTHSPNQMNRMIADYLQEQYQWTIDPDWIVILPSVVSGLYTVVQQLTSKDDGVLVPNPVYHHLRLACTTANRSLQEMPLVLKEGRWVLPSDLFSEIVSAKTKLALFCNPQNPGSTVYTRDELKEFGNFCVQNDLWICSDEIHAGLVLAEDRKHIPLASISKEISGRTVTLMSLNKTFNFPGIGLAWAIAENPELRKAMQVGLHQTIAPPSLLAYTATMVAMKEGEPWRKALIEYLRKNRALIQERIDSIARLSLDKMEGSYLAWIDCTELKNQNPYQLLLDAGLATSPGSQFGRDQFVRLNFGTQRSRLNNALDIIQKACS